MIAIQSWVCENEFHVCRKHCFSRTNTARQNRRFALKSDDKDQNSCLYCLECFEKQSKYKKRFTFAFLYEQRPVSFEPPFILKLKWLTYVSIRHRICVTDSVLEFQCQSTIEVVHGCFCKRETWFVHTKAFTTYRQPAWLQRSMLKDVQLLSSKLI